jgi:hypothetical protein
MQKRQKQVIEAYQRVQAFLADHLLPPPGSYGEPKNLLDDVVARLTTHSNDQVAGGRFGKADTQAQKTLRKVLREQHLKPIAKIAGAVLRGSPGIDKATRMPKPQLTTTQLIAEAGAFRVAATLYEQAFVRNGRPADFIARLDAATEALRQAQLGKARNLGKAIGAKGGMSDEIIRGRDAVEMLDAIVTTSFAGNSEVLAQWRSAKRIRATSGGGNGAVSPTPVPQVAAPAAVSTTEPKAA